MVSQKKKNLVLNLTKQLQEYPVISLVDMENLPAQQLQNMRAMLLKKDILITMTRKKLLKLALTNSKKKNIEHLIEKIRGMPALLLSKENPFTLYSILQKNKSSAPAKANQAAPRDIIIPAGPTSFAPGPIISELAAIGIKTKVEGGKLTITQDTKVAKEGDIISSKLAETLKRLDIQPMEIGLNLVAAWENELVFDTHQLFIDETEYLNNTIKAHQEAFNLAIEAAYPCQETIGLLLQNAFRESKSLSIEQNILTDLTRDEILAKAERQALSVKEEANLDIPFKEIKPAQEPKTLEIIPETPLPKEEKTIPQENHQTRTIPSAEELIKKTQEKFAPSKPEEKHKLAQEIPPPKSEKKPENFSVEKMIDEGRVKKDKEMEKAEALYDQLKKQGTLRV